MVFCPIPLLPKTLVWADSTAVALLFSLSGRVARADFGPDFRIPFVARGLQFILGLHV